MESAPKTFTHIMMNLEDVVKWTGKEDSAHSYTNYNCKKGANPNDTHSDSSQGESIAYMDSC